MQLRGFDAGTSTRLGKEIQTNCRSKSSTGKATWQDEHGRFITAFTKAHHLCLSWATPIKNYHQPNAGRFIL